MTSKLALARWFSMYFYDFFIVFDKIKTKTMSNSQSDDQLRWKIVDTYETMAKKAPNIGFKKVWNRLRFNGYPRISITLVQNTIIRLKNRPQGTSKVALKTPLRPKRKRTPELDEWVINRLENRDVPNFKKSTRYTASKPVGSRRKKAKISRETVRQIYKENDKTFYVKQKRPLLTPHHRRMRYLWAQGNVDKSEDDWIETFAHDETHFETFHRPNRRNAGSWEDTGNPKSNFALSVKHPARISAGIGACGKGIAPIHFFTGKLNQNLFVDTLLEKKYKPTFKKHRCKNLLQDNDSAHTSNKAKKYLEDTFPNYTEAPPRPCHKKRCRCEAPEGEWFPAYLPECQPAEFINQYLQQELDKDTERLGPPANLEVVKRRVRKIAAKMPRSYFKNLFSSMPKRVAALLEAKGGFFTV